MIKAIMEFINILVAPLISVGESYYNKLTDRENEIRRRQAELRLKQEELSLQREAPSKKVLKSTEKETFI